MDEKIFDKIIQKKEFSCLLREDVEIAYSHFEKRQVNDEEKIRLTRELLHKVFGAFSSRKLLSFKDKDAEWFLRKHLSTRERLGFYCEVYKRILGGLGKKFSVIDLGAGINGLSYEYFKKEGFSVSYVAVEAVGQLVDSMNVYFEKNKFDAMAVHESLFDLEKIKSLVWKQKKPRVVLMFKVLDSLEMLEKNYSKNLILSIAEVSERIVVSFATESMVSRKRFRVNRKWFDDFVRENFKILEEFEIGAERFIVFCKR
ncbi:MAG: hypothetical protein KKC19_02230 [Nanoarchaeota archaeon]|nr:hypothetical protein [Nanoarchaeota archaeon]